MEFHVAIVRSGGCPAFGSIGLNVLKLLERMRQWQLMIMTTLSNDTNQRQRVFKKTPKSEDTAQQQKIVPRKYFDIGLNTLCACFVAD